MTDTITHDDDTSTEEDSERCIALSLAAQGVVSVLLDRRGDLRAESLDLENIPGVGPLGELTMPDDPTSMVFGWIEDEHVGYVLRLMVVKAAAMEGGSAVASGGLVGPLADYFTLEQFARFVAGPDAAARKALVQWAVRRAKALCDKHEMMLLGLVDELIEHRTIDGDRLVEVVKSGTESMWLQ